MRSTHYRNYVVNRHTGGFWTYIGGQPKRWRTWDEAATAIDAALDATELAVAELTATDESAG